MQQTKESLKPGEFLVLADFSENYSFVIQDEVQSFHWNNSSATVHPVQKYCIPHFLVEHYSVHMIVTARQSAIKLILLQLNRLHGCTENKVIGIALPQRQSPADHLQSISEYLAVKFFRPRWPT